MVIASDEQPRWFLSRGRFQQPLRRTLFEVHLRVDDMLEDCIPRSTSRLPTRVAPRGVERGIAGATTTRMQEISTVDLEDVIGGMNRTIRTLGTAIGLLANEPLPEIRQPGPSNTTSITRQMDPIQPPALPGGATIVRR